MIWNLILNFWFNIIIILCFWQCSLRSLWNLIFLNSFLLFLRLFFSISLLRTYRYNSLFELIFILLSVISIIEMSISISIYLLFWGGSWIWHWNIICSLSCISGRRICSNMLLVCISIRNIIVSILLPSIVLIFLVLLFNCSLILWSLLSSF
jgi:hypothetical protein